MYPLKYVELIKTYAQEYDVEPELICAVIHAESRFKEDALSNKGAKGLMQLKDSTAAWLAKELGMTDYDKDRLTEPDINIKLGTYYLKKLLKNYKGDIVKTLAAYNAGSGNVSGWLKNPKYSKDGLNLSAIPFPQTQSYIDKVLFNIKLYRLFMD